MLNERRRSARFVAQVALPVLTLFCFGACSAESIREGAQASALDGDRAPVQEGAGFTDSEIDGVATNTATEEVLAQLTVADQMLSFLRWGTGDDAVLVLKSSGGSKESLSDAVERQAGQPLTFLELFRALAPENEIPPAALLEAHAEQALALGRGGEEEVHVVATVDKTVPPPGVDPCTQSLFFPATWIWINLHRDDAHDEHSVTHSAYLCTGPNEESGWHFATSSDCTQYTELRQRAGLCNATGGTVTAQAGYGQLGGGWGVTTGVAVPAGQYTYWEFTPSATKRRLAIIGSDNGSGFRMRSGMALPNIQ